MPVSSFEKDLIHRCCDGNRKAYRELYEKFSGELMAIALRYMKSKQEAEDILQESFIKIFKNLAAFDQRSSLKTWLTRIVINTALNMLRKRHQVINWTTPEIGELEMRPISLSDYHINDLIGFIQGLPTGSQLVFNLYVIEGYSHPEISRMLDISVGTSKSQLHRAKELLQQNIVSDESTIKQKVI